MEDNNTYKRLSKEIENKKKVKQFHIFVLKTITFLCIMIGGTILAQRNTFISEWTCTITNLTLELVIITLIIIKALHVIKKSIYVSENEVRELAVKEYQEEQDEKTTKELEEILTS